MKDFERTVGLVKILSCINVKVPSTIPKELAFIPREKASNLKMSYLQTCRKVKSEKSRHLWTRNCAKCKVEVSTAIHGRSETVCCESCYLSEVY